MTKPVYHHQQHHPHKLNPETEVVLPDGSSHTAGSGTYHYECEK
ncbi:MAG: hypothetical protein ACLRLS_02030 [Roseburia intestinalis]|nr:hypothetical protein [Roseburia intestinalis]